MRYFKYIYDNGILDEIGIFRVDESKDYSEFCYIHCNLACVRYGWGETKYWTLKRILNLVNRKDKNKGYPIVKEITEDEAFLELL